MAEISELDVIAAPLACPEWDLELDDDPRVVPATPSNTKGLSDEERQQSNLDLMNLLKCDSEQTISTKQTNGLNSDGTTASDRTDSEFDSGFTQESSTSIRDQSRERLLNDQFSSSLEDLVNQFDKSISAAFELSYNSKSSTQVRSSSSFKSADELLQESTVWKQLTSSLYTPSSDSLSSPCKGCCGQTVIIPRAAPLPQAAPSLKTTPINGPSHCWSSETESCKALIRSLHLDLKTPVSGQNSRSRKKFKFSKFKLKSEEAQIRRDFDYHSHLTLTTPLTPSFGRNSGVGLATAEQVLEEIDQMLHTMDSELSNGGGYFPKPPPLARDSIREQMMHKIKSLTEEPGRMSAMSLAQLNQLILQLEITIQDNSEWLVKLLAERDDLLDHKEIQNDFIALLMEAEQKKRQLNACVGTSPLTTPAAYKRRRNSFNIQSPPFRLSTGLNSVLTNVNSFILERANSLKNVTAGTPLSTIGERIEDKIEDLFEDQQNQQRMTVQQKQNFQSMAINTVIPYNPHQGPPSCGTVQTLNKLLSALIDDSPLIPALLTDYILKEICPNATQPLSIS